jgi:hypothetical protein
MILQAGVSILPGHAGSADTPRITIKDALIKHSL